MKSRRKLIIHIGLPKTGTTFLQEIVFPQINYTSFYRGWESPRVKLNTPIDNKIIISDEAFVGGMFSGHWRNEFNKSIENIKLIYNNPKIIIGFREHSSLLLSLYKQFLHEKGVISFDEFFNFSNTGIIKTEDIQYNYMLSVLNKNFDNVFVYTQEWMKKDLNGFISNVFNFIGVKENEIANTNVNRNVGVKSIEQVENLIKFNKINKKLEKINPILSLYSPILKRFKLTPRDICTNPKKNKGEIYCLPKEQDLMIKELFKQDWNKLKKQVSNPNA